MEERSGKHVFSTVKVGEKGQIVIPKRARDVFDIRPGDSLIVMGDEQQGGLALIKSDVLLKIAGKNFMQKIEKAMEEQK